MDLVGLNFHTPELEDAKEKFLQIERSDVLRKRSDDVRERTHRSKSGVERSRDDLRTITLEEVAWHDTPDDCWLVIQDYVYDCTEFLKSHPGGQDVLLEYAGRDATLPFIGTGHSAVARTVLDRYKIGELPLKERIFRISNGVRISGF